MKKIALFAAAAAALVSQPVFAQATSVMLIGQFPGQRTTRVVAPLPIEQRIDLFAERVCQKPDLRDLKGRVMFEGCVADVREQVRAQVAGKPAAGLRLAAR